MQTAIITSLDGEIKAKVTITQNDRFTAFHDGRWMNLQLFYAGQERVNGGEVIGVLQFKEFERKFGENVAKELPEVITVYEWEDGNYYMTITDDLLRRFDRQTGKLEGSDMVCEFLEGEEE